jgi:hypothetical protein
MKAEGVQYDEGQGKQRVRNFAIRLTRLYFTILNVELTVN